MKLLRHLLAVLLLAACSHAATLQKDLTLLGTTTLPSTGNFLAAAGSTVDLSLATVTLPASIRIPSAVGNNSLVLSSNGATWIASSAGAGDVTSVQLAGYFANPSSVAGFSASEWRSDLGLGSAALAATSAFEVPLTFSGGVTRTGNTIAVDTASATAAGKVELATDAEAIAGTDTARAVTPANVKAQLLDKAGPVSVKFFGAAGDGSADDTAEIQAALDSAYPWIYVPPGTYNISARLTSPSNKRFTLAPDATIKRVSNSATAMLTNAGDGVTGGYTANTNIIVEGGTWDGNSATYTTAATLIGFGHANAIRIRDTRIINTPTWHAIELNAVSNATIERVVIDNVASNEAIQLDSMVDSSVFPWFGPYDSTACANVTIREVAFTNIQTAIGSHNGASVDGLLVERIRVTSATGAAIKPRSYTNFTLRSSHFIDCAKVFEAFSADDNAGVFIYDNRVSGSTSKDFDLTAVSSGAVYGNRITTSLTPFTNVASSVFVDLNLVNGALVTQTGARTWSGLGTFSAGASVTNAANSLALLVTSPSTTGQSFGQRIYAGTNSSDFALSIRNAADTAALFRIRGDGAIFTGSSAINAFNATGNALMAALTGSSADLAGALTDETGFATGAAAVFSLNPVITYPKVSRSDLSASGTGPVLDVRNNQTPTAGGGAKILFTGSTDTSSSQLEGVWEDSGNNGYLGFWTRTSNSATEKVRIGSASTPTFYSVPGSDFVLRGGASGGAQLTLGQGTSGNVTLTPGSGGSAFVGTATILTNNNTVTVSGKTINGASNTLTVRLANDVSGTLPVANGGTGATTLTGYVKGNGTSAQTASATIPASDVTGLPDVWVFVCSDETTALTTGTAKITRYAPYAATVTGVRATLKTAQASGSIFTVDINEAGTSILSTKLTIDNTEKTSDTAATAAVVSDTSIANGAELTFDIDQIGTSGAIGLIVYVFVTR